MKIFVKTKPSSKKEDITQIDDTHFAIAVKEPPRDGKATIAVMEALSKYFKIPFTRIRLVSGFSNREKVFEIN